MLAGELRDVPFHWAWVAQAAKSGWAIVLLLSEVLSFLLWLGVLADMPLSKAFPITAVGYVAILLMSWTLFREPLVPLQIIGSALILTGVWLINSASREQVSATVAQDG